MMKNILLWVLALIITLGAAVYQRLTGPTYPISGDATFGTHTIHFALDRSHGGADDQRVAVAIPDVTFTGTLMYKRFKTSDPYTHVGMEYAGDSLVANLPHQPPAGKLEYYVELTDGTTKMSLPPKQSVVTRFKGAVPDIVIIPHIILIFLAMLWSTRTGIEALRPKGNTRSLTIQTVVLLAIGGMMMGPIVQKFAFGELWTGVPFGWDLTDNKTLVAFVGWVIALWQHRKTPFPRWFVIAAALILIGIFTIPHSAMGSELNYDTGEVQTG